jgi:hypothetical protein
LAWTSQEPFSSLGLEIHRMERLLSREQIPVPSSSSGRSDTQTPARFKDHGNSQFRILVAAQPSFLQKESSSKFSVFIQLFQSSFKIVIRTLSDQSTKEIPSLGCWVPNLKIFAVRALHVGLAWTT